MVLLFFIQTFSTVFQPPRYNILTYVGPTYRLSVTQFVGLDNVGKTTDSKFGRTVLNNDHRLSEMPLSPYY